MTEKGGGGNSGLWPVRLKGPRAPPCFYCPGALNDPQRGLAEVLIKAPGNSRTLGSRALCLRQIHETVKQSHTREYPPASAVLASSVASYLYELIALAQRTYLLNNGGTLPSTRQCVRQRQGDKRRSSPICSLGCVRARARGGLRFQRRAPTAEPHRSLPLLRSPVPTCRWSPSSSGWRRPLNISEHGRRLVLADLDARLDHLPR